MSQTLGDPFITPPFGTDFGAGTAVVESSQGTTISTVGPIIRNSALDAFGLSAVPGKVLVNGVVDPATSNVKELLYWTINGVHAVFQQNTANNWYYKALVGNAWAGPLTSLPIPLPTPVPTPKITHAILQTRLDSAIALLNGIRSDLASLSP